MRETNNIILLAGILFLAGCTEKAPPVSVQEFVDNPRLLEATMVRCAENRSTMKYESECVNAREAINRIEAADANARRGQMEAQSERKRQALRRSQQAAADARRRAVEAQRMREEAEYLGLFEQPETAGQPAEAPQQQERAAATVPQAAAVPQTATEAPSEPAPVPQRIIETEAPEPQSEEPTASDLQSIREELQRRRDDAENNN